MQFSVSSIIWHRLVFRLDKPHCIHMYYLQPESEGCAEECALPRGCSNTDDAYHARCYSLAVTLEAPALFSFQMSANVGAFGSEARSLLVTHYPGFHSLAVVRYIKTVEQCGRLTRGVAILGLSVLQSKLYYWN